MPSGVCGDAKDGGFDWSWEMKELDGLHPDDKTKVLERIFGPRNPPEEPYPGMNQSTEKPRLTSEQLDNLVELIRAN